MFMFTHQKFLSLLLSTIVSFSGVQTAALCQDSDPGFYATVHERFSVWDANKDGVLTENEIVSRFQSKNCRGRGAAAIAVLNQLETGHLVKKEPLESFTLEQFDQMEANAKVGHDKHQKKYENCLKRINERSQVLFAHELPQIDGTAQHNTNDCYFLAVVASLSRQRPLDLKKLIEDNNDGSFTVRFFGVDPIRVGCISDAEIASYASSDDGLWVPVLLKAFGKLSLRKRWHGKDQTPIHEDPLEAMAIHGGSCAPVVGFLSGHAVNTKKPQEIAGNLRNQLKSAFDQHQMVMCGVPGHALAVMGYDRKLDQVQIWNPWGTDGAYKGLDVTMQKGFFTMPVSALVERCNHIVFETTGGAPLPSKYVDEVGGQQSGGNGGGRKQGSGHKQRGR
jgi:hypothetical protein